MYLLFNMFILYVFFFDATCPNAALQRNNRKSGMKFQLCEAGSVHWADSVPQNAV